MTGKQQEYRNMAAPISKARGGPKTALLIAREPCKAITKVLATCLQDCFMAPLITEATGLQYSRINSQNMLSGKNAFETKFSTFSRDSFH